MMKYFTLIAFFVLIACGNKEDILLPKAATTIVKDVTDLSPIYIFFRTNEKDTLAEVNRKNSIISTNWILNIDKRLPLRLVIPEVMKLQKKKREEKAHKNEKAENYYSYADTIGKNLAFIPFTNVFYKMEKPIIAKDLLYFKANGVITYNSQVITKKELAEVLNNIVLRDKIIFCYDENMSYGKYIYNKVLIESFNVSKEEIDLKENFEFFF